MHFQQDGSKDESTYESADEYDEPIVNPVEDLVEDRRPRMLRELDSDLGRGWESTGSHMVSAIMVAEQAGVRMMKEYFEIEASKATPQYGFRKGLTLFGDKGYQAAKNELKLNLHVYSEEDASTCSHGRILLGTSENKD